MKLGGHHYSFPGKDSKVLEIDFRPPEWLGTAWTRASDGQLCGCRLGARGTCSAVVAAQAEFVEAPAVLHGEPVVVGERGVRAVPHVHAQLVAALGRDPVYVVQPCGEGQRMWQSAAVASEQTSRGRGGNRGSAGPQAAVGQTPPPQTGSPPADGQPSVLTPSPDPAGTCLGVPTLSPPLPTVNRGTGGKRPEAPEGPGRQAPCRRRGCGFCPVPPPPSLSLQLLTAHSCLPGNRARPRPGDSPHAGGSVSPLTPDAGQAAGPLTPAPRSSRAPSLPEGPTELVSPTATRGLFPPLYAAPRGLPQRKAGTGTPVAGASCRGTQLGTQTPGHSTTPP